MLGSVLVSHSRDVTDRQHPRVARDLARVHEDAAIDLETGTNPPAGPGANAGPRSSMRPP